MFLHAYKSYMNNAFPADELMPIACTGRVRGKTPSRGDVDESFGKLVLLHNGQIAFVFIAVKSFT